MALGDGAYVRESATRASSVGCPSPIPTLSRTSLAGAAAGAPAGAMADGAPSAALPTVRAWSKADTNGCERTAHCNAGASFVCRRCTGKVRQ